MKRKNNLIEQLKNLPHFTKSTVRQLGAGLGLKDATISVYISRFLRSREIYRLKNGLYVSASFFDRNKGDVSYSFYLANILRKPSYVSSWAALQYYNLTTEAIYSITSVTQKVTRDYQTKAGNFSYQSINEGLFSDFVHVKRKFDFFVASPSKALFDLLYFRTNEFKSVSIQNIKTFIEGLRIDIEEMDKEEQAKFYSLIKKYLHE
ncbi:MAG: hypothetical protein WCT02_00640 [Candidatus Paceibacterota bacterium]